MSELELRLQLSLIHGDLIRLGGALVDMAPDLSEAAFAAAATLRWASVTAASSQRRRRRPLAR